MAAASSANPAAAAPIFTLVPEHEPIELVAYYPEFADYYPDCELQTKRWFVENARRDWTIFDVGANIGYYSILFSRLAPRGCVYAFEPTETIELLQKNLDHHCVANVQPLRIALGTRSGRIEEDIYRIRGQAPERKEYDFATLDEMVGRLGLDRLDCVKIDVDSFDFEVLQGAERTLEQLNPWIVVELNHALAKRIHSAGEALEWLAARGYTHAHVLDYENYVLRRRPAAGASPGASLPELRLSFEQRPVMLREAWDNGPPIADYFARQPTLHNATSVTSKSGHHEPVISVPGPRWSYAASWPRITSEPVRGPLVVEVELTVTGGEVGLGCVSPAMDRYLGRQVFALAVPARQSIIVTVPDGAAVGHLMLRNADANGQQAAVSIHRISVFHGLPSSWHASSLLARNKRRLSVSECEAALAGIQPSAASTPYADPGIDIVPVEELGLFLRFLRPFAVERKIYKNSLADFQTEPDEAAIYTYIYRNAKPARHLEFGTWEGFGSTLCARACAAEIWTINLPGGESDAAGRPLYGSTDGTGAGDPSHEKLGRGDSGDRIGWRYRAAGFVSRVHQILCDSRDFDSAQFPLGSFDTVLIDGGHSPEVAANDTNKALPLLRAGGIMIWHDFCPDVEALSRNEAPRGVVRAIIDNFAEWSPHFSRIAWIRPSWMLIGVKK